MFELNTISQCKSNSEVNAERLENFCPEFMLSVMCLAAEMGCIGSLTGMMENRGQLVRQYGNNQQKRMLERLEGFLERAIKIEATWGEGSLLQLHHPFVQSEIKNKRISSNEVLASQRLSDDFRLNFKS
ncbi:hypothetical protein [Ochrobactrum sp. 19YEA23]|uniref:hypothetical protein n=1 Tax=Ochrobactrum sp. 19YEA23 TaxID=3039854 RepID=UPI00247A7278